MREPTTTPTETSVAASAGASTPRHTRARTTAPSTSDDEMSAASFPDVWQRRDADLVLGYRVGRESPRVRRIVTAVSRWTVRCLFGAGVRDVNTPYRLYRHTLLTRLLPLVPPDA